MTDASRDKPEIADSQLNLIYNACDVGLNTATGEGWGLVAFEHAAAFAAQIVPDHSACAELWREAGLLAPLAHSAAEFHPDLAGVIATDRCGDLLADLYRDRTRLAGLQDKAFRHATDRCFDWSAIADRWAQLFMDLLAPQFGSKSHSHTN
jgi:glycosyltransferase involved in cell wall biosynthesis